MTTAPALAITADELRAVNELVSAATLARPSVLMARNVSELVGNAEAVASSERVLDRLDAALADAGEIVAALVTS